MIGESKKIGASELELFNEHLTMLVDTGLPLPDGIARFASEVKDAKFRESLTRLVEGLTEGRSLSDAMEDEKTFPAEYIAMIRMGEKGGNLVEALGLAIEHELFQRGFEDKLRQSLAYPIIVFALVSVSYFVLVIMSYPVFKFLYSSFGAKLPWPSIFISGMFNLMWGYGLIVAIAILAASLLLNRPQIKSSLHNLWLMIPFLRTVLIERFVTSFSQGLSILLRAKVPLPDAVKALIGITSNRSLKSKLQKAAASLDEGAPLSGALISAGGVFPELFTETVAIGEEGGMLPDSLAGLARMYRSETAYHASVFLRALDVGLIIMLGVWVALLLAAMYMMYWRVILIVDAAKVW